MENKITSPTVIRRTFSNRLAKPDRLISEGHGLINRLSALAMLMSGVPEVAIQIPLSSGYG